MRAKQELAGSHGGGDSTGGGGEGGGGGGCIAQLLLGGVQGGDSAGELPRRYSQNLQRPLLHAV